MTRRQSGAGRQPVAVRALLGDNNHRRWPSAFRKPIEQIRPFLSHWPRGSAKGLPGAGRKNAVEVDRHGLSVQ